MGRVLEKVESFLIVRNDHTDLYGRAWCVCELVFARDAGLWPDRTMIVGPNKFSHVTSTCVAATSFSKKDKEPILQEFRTKHILQNVDKFVNEFRASSRPKSL